MTMIITRVGMPYALQVVDRLVTYKIPGQPITKYDHVANKTLIFVAKDACVTISYSGAAYLKGRTTDQWIAEKVLGEDLAPPPGTPGGGIPIRFESDPRPTADIGLAVLRLRQELAAVVSPMSPDWRLAAAPQVTIAGWQWTRRRTLRPLLVSLRDQGHGELYRDCYWSPRQGWIRRSTRAGMDEFDYMVETSPRGVIPNSERTELAANIRTIDATDDVEQLFIEKIRETSDSNEAIGKDCLSVLVGHPNDRIIRVRFHPFVERREILEMSPSGTRYELPVSFSPWIIGRGVVSPPQLTVGSFETSVPSSNGNFVVQVEAPEHPTGKGLLALGLSQERPPWPPPQTSSPARSIRS